MEKMPIGERARQFMPFAALRGYEEVIKEKEKILEGKREISEERAEELSSQILKLKKGDVVSVIYYLKDGYVEMRGAITEIDVPFKTFRIIKTWVPFVDVYDLKLL